MWIPYIEYIMRLLHVDEVTKGMSYNLSSAQLRFEIHKFQVFPLQKYKLFHQRLIDILVH